MRNLITLAAIFWSGTVLAEARGTSVYKAHCARCHVVGQGQPVRAKTQSFIDITLAARNHDDKWLLTFLQKPTSVAPQTACRTKVNEKDANDLLRFLKRRLRPAPQGAPGPGGGAPAPGRIPPESEWHTAAPLPRNPKASHMVHR